MLYAEVVIKLRGGGVRRSFTYRVPEDLAPSVIPGALVTVPFGRNGKTEKGYVITLSGTSDVEPEKLKDILSVVTDEEAVESRLVQLASWMAEQYSCDILPALRTVLPGKKVARRKTKEIISLPEADGKRPVLTAAQADALSSIRRIFRSEGKPVLLHGLTGSGKTLLYMELIAEAVRSGGQAIVLIPEIALTYQTARRFAARFGDRVAFMHSRLSDGEKYELCRKARCGETDIVIGPRSALFTPFPHLRLIVMDEEQEDTYRSELTPRYHARETAEKRAAIEGAYFLMGSATPSVEAYRRAETGEYGLVELNERYGAGARNVICVDMKEELASGNRSVFSRSLHSAIDRTLLGGKQVMLFLNRRGYAGFISCRRCGYVAKCPHCDVSLTEHADGTMRCHYCGYTAEKAKVCPSCGSKAVGGMKIGTEQVERLLERDFPQAKVARMDADTTAGKAGHAEILRSFAEGGANVLLGTQMIVKGHDFPNVALIGILMADLSLNESDFRSAERTYSLLAQAIGRTGRSGEEGTAIVQTYEPEHYAVRCALTQDYRSFYREEIAYRKLLRYPPCGHLCAVLGSGENEEMLHTAMEHLVRFLGMIDPANRLSLIGPAYPPVRKVRDQYREMLYLRSERKENLIAANEKISRYVAANRGFSEISIQFDYNI